MSDKPEWVAKIGFDVGTKFGNTFGVEVVE